MEKRESVRNIIKFNFSNFILFKQELQDRILALTNERNDYETTTMTANERIKQIEHVKQVNISIEKINIFIWDFRVSKIDINNQKMKNH